MGLLNDLGRGPVALDSSIFIYFIEEHPRFLPVVKPVFSSVAAREVAAVTSSLTLLEVLVRPLRANLPALAAEYEQILTRSTGITLIPLDLALLRLAAQLRATCGLKTPDALQLAAALESGCSVFLTNDERIPQVPGLRVLRAQDYLEPG
ncbi:MAG TPA: PIN domain-containing protein [Thermoanaerobaculia bacterium]|nr:PIN domain-containing protein [Thermoanaerobaculia bacterium]